MARRSRSKTDQDQPKTPPSRRNFIKGGGLILAGHAIASNQLAVAQSAHAFGSDQIKIGLIGCGRRGIAATIEMLNTDGGATSLVSMADVYQGNVQSAYRTIRGKHRDSVDLQDRRYHGFDSYRQVIEGEADVVILATPPAFRPKHFEAAIESGKHVFMEKPVATDPAGVRRILQAGEKAAANGIAVAVGLQRRHDQRYRECIQKLRDGIIGDPVFARAYWNGAGTTARPRKKGQSELDYQLRNWYQFAWLGGDIISEQHIHNLDVINWLMGSHPVEAQGQGARISDANVGQIFDHHMVEYTYASGAKLLSQCRHQRGCWNRVGENIHCTRGSADISAAKIFDDKGDLVWQSKAKEHKGRGLQQQQDDLIAALRRGERPGEVAHGATSTMTAIMGRMATYSGKLVKWDAAINSTELLANVDSVNTLAAQAPVQPDANGLYPVPVPGKSVRQS